MVRRTLQGWRRGGRRDAAARMSQWRRRKEGGDGVWTEPEGGQDLVTGVDP